MFGQNSVKFTLHYTKKDVTKIAEARLQFIKKKELFSKPSPEATKELLDNSRILGVS